MMSFPADPPPRDVIPADLPPRDVDLSSLRRDGSVNYRLVYPWIRTRLVYLLLHTCNK